jgi:hypothetical protein
LGLVIAWGVPDEEPNVPPPAGADAEMCGMGPAIVAAFDYISRGILGITIGSMVGGISGVILLTLLRRLAPYTRVPDG